MGRVLVACEFSGIVRDAFIRAGHDAISVDIIPSESDFGPHHQGDAVEFMNREGSWDLVIAHPPCTYLTNSGARWLYKQGTTERDEERWQAMNDGADFFNEFVGAANRVAIKNPIPHKHARNLIGNYTQKIQPYQFGHGETKATCLWLENLPELVPTDIVEGREARVHRASPGPDRWKERSRTFVGIAEAMAQQWGKLI